MINYQPNPKDFKIEKWTTGIYVTNLNRFWSDVIPPEIVVEMYRLLKSGEPAIVKREK